MPATENGSSSSARITQFSDHFSSTRSFADLPELHSIRVSFDIVSAARRTIAFLRNVHDSLWLHEPAYLAEAVRRYDELWMPLISELTVNGSSNVGSTVPMILPPFDVEWVWFCHSLNPFGSSLIVYPFQRSYRQYCEQRFSRLIGKPTIFDEENEDYALIRCKKLWLQKYPNEPFENEASESAVESRDESVSEELLNEVAKNRHIYKRFCWPYVSEIVYLIAAKQRYKGFLFVLQSCIDGNRDRSSRSRLVPSLDILLMWITHQSYPTLYAQDLKEIEAADMVKTVVGLWDTAEEQDVQETNNLWDKAFDQPYEKAGGATVVKQPPLYWEVSDTDDVNSKYKSLHPRFLLEVCVFVRPETFTTKNEFLRMRMVRCHKELKIDTPGTSLLHDSWSKLGPSLYCEFGTRGVVVELRRKGGGICFKSMKVDDTVTFLWNDLLRAPSLSLERKLGEEGFRAVASITPPVQAPYLLKCVPDRVTDDSGAMISDVILRMNNYKPQEGRWLSRTVLDHAGRECFVVRMRVGGGFWRRGGETPSAVKWDDRIVEVREGSWSYVAGSIGRAPEKLVGTATPKEPPENWESAWLFSSGDELLVSRSSPSPSPSSSNSNPDLRFRFSNQSSSPSSSSVKLLRGRKMQYNDEQQQEAESEAETGFVTLVRYSEDDPIGKATALLNWKLLIMESQPEEDAVLVLLICIAIVRSVSEIRKEDVGKLLIRRRVREAKMGDRDWGSVIVGSSSSAYLQPWYLNGNAEIAVCSDRGEDGVAGRQQQPAVSSYSLVEGGDKLYKKGIIM
ncbi:Glycine-rich domain-containing protein 1 [Linum perenne]